MVKDAILTRRAVGRGVGNQGATRDFLDIKY